MALDAATLELTARELKTVLADAKIAKLFEPTRDELVITLRTRTDTYALLLSARSGSARVCLTEETFENPVKIAKWLELLYNLIRGDCDAVHGEDSRIAG